MITINTKPNYIVRDDLNAYLIVVTFPVGKVELEDIYKVLLMVDFMNDYSVNYPEEDLFLRALDKNFIGSYNVTRYVYGDESFVEVSFMLPKEGLFDDYSSEDSLKLMKDIIFNSICIDEKYITDKIFYTAVNIIKNKIIKRSKTIGGRITSEWSKILDGKRVFTLTDDDYLDVLSKVKKEDIVNSYKNIVLSGKYMVNISGPEVGKSHILNIVNENFASVVNEFTIKANYFPIYDAQKRGLTHLKGEYNQSVISTQYEYKNYTKDDYFTMMLINVILNRQENSFLLKKLRFNNNLVYGCDSLFKPEIKSIVVTAFLSKKNIDKCKQLIDETINMLKDRDTFEEAKRKLLKADEISLYDSLDSKFNDLKVHICHLINKNTFEDEYNKLKDVSYEDVIKIIDGLEIVNTLLIEGEYDD